MTNATLLLMYFWSIPHLMNLTNGLPIFDIRPTRYNFEETLTIIYTLGSVGREFYLNTQQRIDTIYPGLFIITYSISGFILLPKSTKDKIISYILMVSSFMGGGFDYLENYRVRGLLLRFPAINREMVEKANFATVSKTVFSTLALCLFFYCLGQFLYITFKKKRP